MLISAPKVEPITEMAEAQRVDKFCLVKSHVPMSLRFQQEETVVFRRYEKEARERLMFVVHRSLLKHWKIQMFENLNRLAKSGQPSPKSEPSRLEAPHVPLQAASTFSDARTRIECG